MLKIIGLSLAIAIVNSAPDDVRHVSDAEGIAYFEQHVRPILFERCFKCHSSEKPKGGLRLDSRAALIAGGDLGPAIVAGKPDESLLVSAIHYEDDALRMPPKSRLPDREIAALTRWVELGAPWPDAAATPSIAKSKVEIDLKERARHWSFQPVKVSTPPAIQTHESWPWNPIDRFLLSRMVRAGLGPAPDCDLRTWFRRVSFDLIGLPPEPAELAAFLEAAADNPDRAMDAAVERLLASPHYGERWGRHWLDLVRYAETSGHEFDYDIPDAWRYRDYVVRAFNSDLPFDRFITEQIAGDLLPDPRRNPIEGFNESILGTGLYFLGEGVHSPVDLPDDEAARIDNQIDVISKAFLGLTIACARCHDHKFDPITARDYYALFGILQSSRHDHARFESADSNHALIAALKENTRSIRAEVERLGTCPQPVAAQVEDDGSFVFEDFGTPGYPGWFVTGDAFEDGPTHDGEIRVTSEGDAPGLLSLDSGMAHSGRTSDRLEGVLRSRTFAIDRPYIHIRAAGRAARINLIIDGFEKVRSPIYGQLALRVDSPSQLKWFTIDARMWAGHRAYIELSDGGTLDYAAPKGASYVDGGGYLAVDQIRSSDHAAPPKLAAEAAGMLPISADSPTLKERIAQHRALEGRIEAPHYALAITDGTPADARVAIRGNPHNPGEVVPRGFPQAFGARSEHTLSGSGRRELAGWIADPENPLTARVLVNRLWMHHFGEGLVRTPDNFGIMGEPPSHPALLDWLAVEFVKSGWSIKQMHRLMVRSHAYRMSSRIEPESESSDPRNQRLHRMNLRRLEAEPLRDALLQVSGRLDPRMFGASTPPLLTPSMQGRGRPAHSGPLDGDGRRTLYLNVRRNFLPSMLLAFDFPSLATCVGRRNVSNVPAQALTLLNDPFVLQQAEIAGRRVLNSPNRTTEARLDALFHWALARPPSETESAAARAFLGDNTDQPQTWADLCHVLFNMKEFAFIE